ncbi:TadE/TadG family type IV pilus assembly protein [Aestuariivirga sp.]|uniref:TadE/TadG family type IV pilus assembly protein n=1 Tax=Aestuariivirga sp. TaxID=2650926 RepID=UPI00301646B3
MPGNSGVAAIEFAIVFPILLMLLFGIINVVQDLAMSRRITAAAELVADLVTRRDTTIQVATIKDYFTAAELAIRPVDAKTVHIDLYNFYKDGSTVGTRWKRSSPNGTACTVPAPRLADPNDAIGSLLNDPTVVSDVVVAVICMPYVPPVANFPGIQNIFKNRTIQKTIALRPRQSTILLCDPASCI